MRPHLLSSLLTLIALLLTPVALPGCDQKPAVAPTPTPGPESTGAAMPSKDPTLPKDPAPPKDEVKISKELWPNGKLKYSYELRRGADGKWGRNGIGRAFYDTGELEREGMYRDGVRVGEWKYFDPSGKVLRTEQRGNDGQGGP